MSKDESKPRQRKRKSEIAEIIDTVLDKMIELATRARVWSDPVDFLVFLFIIAMLSGIQGAIQGAIQAYPATYPAQQVINQVLQPVLRKSLTVEQVLNIIKQCEKSKEPLECIKNTLLGG
jgi:hypothetical protein